jgi:hypothetical protein
MRVFGFSEKWGKLHLELPVLERPDFTTFRMPRTDADKGRDWHVGETLQIVFKARTPGREILGTATIIGKESTYLARVTDDEAIRDGFWSRKDMLNWFAKTHGFDVVIERSFNKLTFRWCKP